MTEQRKKSPFDYFDSQREQLQKRREALGSARKNESTNAEPTHEKESTKDAREQRKSPFAYFKEQGNKLQESREAFEEQKAKASQRSLDEEGHVKKADSKKREGLDGLLNEVKERAKTYGREIKEGTQAIARGVAPLPDLALWPVRKGVEKVTGYKVPTLHELSSIGYKEPDWETEPGKAAIHQGLEWAGTVVPGAGLGNALIKAGKFLGTPYVSKGISKIGEFLGGGAYNTAMKGNVKPLAEMAASAIPMGMTAKTIKEESGIDPIIGDILGSVVGGLFYGMARNVGNVSLFAKRVINGDVGHGVRQSFLKNLEEAVGTENVDPIIKKLQSYEPVMEGHAPTVAEMMVPTQKGEAALPQVPILERAFAGTPKVAAAKENTQSFINQTLNDLEHPNASIEGVRSGLDKAYRGDRKAVEDILSNLEARRGAVSSSRDVGETLRSETKKHLTKGWEERKAATQKHWDAVAEDEGLATLAETGKAVNKGLKVGIADSEALSHYNRVNNLLGKKGKKDVDISFYDQELPNMSDYIREQLAKNMPEPVGAEMGKGPRISVLDAERQQVKEAYKDALNEGKAGRARHLRVLKEGIEQDLESVSKDATMARQKYAEFSPPINKINDVDSLSPYFKKYNNEYKKLDTEVGEAFTKGKNAPERIDNLFEAYKTRGEAGHPHIEAVTEGITSHASHDLFDTVVNKDGLVDLRKLNSFEGKMTGVKKVNPKFVKDMKALAEAQKNLESQFGREKGGARDILLEGNDKQVVREILGSNNKQKALNEVLERLKKVGHADDRHGLVNGVLEHMQDSIRGKSKSAPITPTAYKSYFNRHHDLLKGLLDPDQFRMLKGINKIVGQDQFVEGAGRLKNSQTQPLTKKAEIFTEEGRGLLRKLLHMGSTNFKKMDTVFKLVSDNIGKDVKTLKTEMLQDFLTDAEQAIKDLHAIKTVPKESIFAYTRHNVPRNVLNYLIAED